MARTYLRYAKSGKEFEVTEALQELGLNAWCGKKMEVRRVGKKRDPVATVKPSLGNYIFVEMENEDFARIGNVKHLSPTHYVLNRYDLVELGLYRKAVEDDYSAVERQVDIATHLCEFTEGEALRVVSGSFRDTLGTFRGMVERAEGMRYKMEADMMGQRVDVEIDPADLKRAG